MKKAIAILLIVASLLSSNPVSAEPVFTPIQVYNAPPEISWGATFQYINDTVSLAFIQTIEKYNGIVELRTASILVSKTTDGGATWSEAKILFKGIYPDGFAAIMPSPIYDYVSGKVYLLYSMWNGDSRLRMIESEDLGETWVNNREIVTGKFYPLPSNASGIVLNDGTLVIPIAYYKYVNYYQSSVIRSTDHGATWQLGGVIDFEVETGNGCDEPAVTALTGGQLYALVRTNQGYIGQSLSYDGGLSWTPVRRTDFQSIGGGFDGQQVELRVIDSVLYMAYAGANRDSMHIGTLRKSENNAETWSEPITLGSDTASFKGCFHLSKISAHQAVISWWSIIDGEWKGEVYKFLPEEVFAPIIPPGYDMPYLPPADFKKKEYTPQPVIEPPFALQ